MFFCFIKISNCCFSLFHIIYYNYTFLELNKFDILNSSWRTLIIYWYLIRVDNFVFIFYYNDYMSISQIRCGVSVVDYNFQADTLTYTELSQWQYYFGEKQNSTVQNIVLNETSYLMFFFFISLKILNYIIKIPLLMLI